MGNKELQEYLVSTALHEILVGEIHVLKTDWKKEFNYQINRITLATPFKKILNIFSNLFFYFKVQSFRLIMETNSFKWLPRLAMHDRCNFQAHYRLCAAVFHQ